MLISDIHYSIVIGCGGELNQSDCLYVVQKGVEGAEGMEGTEGVEGMTYIKALWLDVVRSLTNQIAYM